MANIAANKHEGEFDLSMLRPLVSDLYAEGIDTDLLGYTAEEIDYITSSLSFTDDDIPDDDHDDDEILEPMVTLC